GQAIFERVAGGYNATHLGKQLIAAAEKMEDISFSVIRQDRAAEPEISGPITLSVPKPIAQFLLVDALAKFTALHPKIDLTIETSYQYVNLDRSEADVVVRGTNAPPEHLVGRRLFPYALCHYGVADYLENTAPADRKWLIFSPRAEAQKWIAKSPFPDADIAMHVDDLTYLHHCAVAGHGMIYGACYMGDPEPKLTRLPGTKPTPIADLWVLTHPDLRDTPKIKTLMKFLAETLNVKRDLIEGRWVGSVN
ncbi:MAG: LysR family transcriptional regulator, partial [Robiginitomaculum sp.]|nr:LysR family transcriptional regulator [Robiginitomaculum sp.]